MKKGVKWLLCIAAGMVILGISTIGVVEDMTNNTEKTFTVDQRNVLLSAGVPEARIEQNILLGSEQALLKALAQAQDFMAARYPEETFVFTGLDNTSPRGGSWFLEGVSSSAPDKTFAVKVTDAEITESYYGIAKQAELVELVRDAFAQRGLEVGLDLKIYSLYGSAHSPEKTLAQTLSEGMLVNVTGWAYVQAPVDLAELEQYLVKTLRGAGLCGSFRVSAIQGASIEEVLALPRTNREFVVEWVSVSLPAKMSEVK